MNEPSSLDVLIVFAVAGGVLAVLWRAGVLSGRAFEHAPPRRGRLGFSDLLIGLGLFILGPGVVMVLMQSWMPTDAANDPTSMLWRMLASQVGLLPLIGYVLLRASMAVEGGVSGFGLGMRSAGRGAAAAVMGSLAIIPLVVAVSMLVTLLTTALGYEPPAIAHDALRVLAQSPWGPLRWGLILSAVIVAPVLEEILFRGLLQTVLLQSGLLAGRWSVIFLASVLFTLVHAGVADWYAMPTLFILALGLGYAYERTGTLWAPIGMHAIFNAVNIALALTMLSPDG